MTEARVPLKALLIGAVTGLRSMTGIAVLSNSARPIDSQPRGSFLKILESVPMARTLAICALGELVADKLPFIPSRISPAGLTARVTLGAACGAALYMENRRPAGLGAVLGTCGALAASFAGYYLRRSITRNGAPDLAVALVEDGIAIGGALSVRRPVYSDSAP